MVKRGIKIILIATFIIIIFAFFVLPKTGFTVFQSDVLIESDLEDLKLQAKVECMTSSANPKGCGFHGVSLGF